MSAVLDVNVNPRGAVAGAAVAGSALDQLKAKALGLETTLNNTAKTSNRVGAAFGALVGSFAVAGVLRASDAYTTVNNRLKLVTASQEELAVAYKKVYQLAQDTRGPLEATGKFYAQLSLNAKSLKLTQEDLITVTGTLNKIIALTGQSAEASSNAIIQLQQALGSGALRGDELRSIMEQLPLLGQIIADSMGIAYGRLKEVGQEGKITAKIVTDALKASAEDIDKAFKNMTFTFGQAFTMLYNGFVNAIGQINEATGLFSALAKGIAYVGYYMTELIQLTGVFAAALITVKAAGFISYLQQSAIVVTSMSGGMARSIVVTTVWQAAIMRLGQTFVAAKAAMIGFMLSNPFTALLTGLVLILPLLYQFRDSIVLSRDGTVTLGTVFSAVFAKIQAAMPIVLEVFNSLMQTVYDLVTAVGTALIPVWTAAQAAFDALYPAIQAIIGAFGGTATKITAVSFAFAAMIATFNPWIAAAIAVIAVLNTLDPGLSKTTFALTVMGEAIGVLIKLALVPLVVAFQAVVNIMAAFGFINVETAQSVNTQADAFIKSAGSLDGMTERVQAAYDEMVKADEAASRSGEAASMWGAILDDKLNPALGKTAESSTKTAKSAGELATGVDNINRSLEKTPEATKKVDNSFAQNAIFANQNRIAIDALTASLVRLAAQQKAMSGGAAAGAAQILGGIQERAKGGPVEKNKPYLVGERGPELFTPNTAGTITKNSDLNAMSSFQAANDNRPGRLEPSPATDTVVKQVTRMANSVVDSNEQVIAATKAWTMTNYKDSSYAEVKKYEGVGTAEDRWKNYGGTKTINGITVSGADYVRPDGYRPLPGDADYVANTQSYGGVWGDPTGMRGGFVYSGSQDLNDPTYQMRNTAALYKALGNDARALAADKAADEMIQRLKDIRDNTAAFKAFKETYQAGMGTPTTIDFQTLFPNGSPAFAGNPYMVGKGNAPSMLNLTPPSSKKSNDKGEGSDKPTQINMVVMTPNADSFRKNRAQVEGEVYGMVKRAQRRAAG